MKRIHAVEWYAGLVSVAGCAFLFNLLAARGVAEILHHPGLFVFVLGLLVVCELQAVRPVPGKDAGQVTQSPLFIFALLLASGVASAALALASASVIADVWQRKSFLRVAFNVGQYSLAVGLAGALLGVLSGGRALLTEPQLALADLAVLFTTAIVFMVATMLLVAIVVALHTQIRVRDQLRQDLWYQVTTSGALVILSPVIVLAARHSLLLLPAFLLPMWAFHRSASVSLAREHDSLHDPLTGLPNRTLFNRRVREVVDEARASGQQAAVMVVDLDHFKEVNDTLGHQIGDELLREAGTRLQETAGERAIVARLGGDEFAVLISDVTDPAAVVGVADSLLRALDKPFLVHEFSLNIEASIGIALYPDHGEDGHTLMRCADVAMYVAKEERGGVELYTPERDQHTRRRLALLGDLRAAVENCQLVLHYQPKVDLATGRVTAVEALVRWQHPTLGLLSPVEFVPLAERTIHMSALTLCILEEALRQCSEWRDEGLRLGVSVNLPVQNLTDLTFPDTVAQLLGRHDVVPSWLELEVTESSIMADPDRAMLVLGELHQMGVRLAIDDFGTGYSSLSHLKQMPVDTIKIDKSFVMDMSSDTDDAVIVNSTVNLARNLGLQTVAEGVEDEETMRALARLGCDGAQGFFISRPLPAAQLVTWLDGLAPGLRLVLPMTIEKASA